MEQNSVRKGIQFEEEVVKRLIECGLDAWRTNLTNPDDPMKYKHGFDGGVDIIARYSASNRVNKDFVFFIQCKCHKNDLTKSAIAEAYAGMHARKGFGDKCVPVVFAVSDASEETIEYAKDLGVELFLANEFRLLQQAETNKSVPYGNYGTLLKVLLYHYTNDSVWLDTLPESKNILSDLSMTERLLEESKTDFDSAQSHLDRASSMERKAQEERQKALDIQKVAVYRSIQACGLRGTAKQGREKKEMPTVVEDTG